MPRKPVSRKKSSSTSKRLPARARANGRGPLVAEADQPVSVPRATPGYDEDDVMLSGGSIRGIGYGRCGGRILSSRIEQTLCDKLSRTGVTHSHAPRHFEVGLADETVAAYAPMIVLRGRGREGKTVVIEAADQLDKPTLGKIAAFRRRLGLEFYVIFVAPEDVLDEVPFDVYDESCTDTDVDTLVSRLTD